MTKPIMIDMRDRCCGTVTGLWQYDYGRVLKIQDDGMPTAVEIHFSLQENGGNAVPRVGTTRDGVTEVVIPDSMLENEVIEETGYQIHAFIQAGLACGLTKADFADVFYNNAAKLLDI